MRECSQENAWNFDKWPIWKAITWERALIHFLWNQEPFSDSSDSFSDIDPNFKFKSLFFWTSISKWTSYCSDAFCTLILMMKSFSTFIKILTVDTDNLNLKIPRFRNTTVQCTSLHICSFFSLILDCEAIYITLPWFISIIWKMYLYTKEKKKKNPEMDKKWEKWKKRVKKTLKDK